MRYVCCVLPASEQLEHEDAQRPVVGRDVVSLVEDDLRRHVLGRPAKRPRLSAVPHLLGEPEIDLKINSHLSHS